MELGSKVSRGGTLIAMMVGVACHAMGFARVEKLVSQMPAPAIPQALDRVRRIRRTWPVYTENLEIERLDTLAGWTKAAQSYQQSSPLQTLSFLWDRVRDIPSSGLKEFRQGVALWLAPKRRSLTKFDGYFRQTMAEYSKPLRLRKAVETPDDALCRYSILDSQTAAGAEAKWWRPQLDLALLEAALAVRLYRLENGRFPARLSDIPRQWLPAVPSDPWSQPIVYRLKNGSPLIYSFGPDGRDDGGRPADALQLAASTRGDLVWGSLSRRHH